ncbi:MAG: DUF721 domain-containing protein [Endomicrobiia bacterium]
MNKNSGFTKADEIVGLLLKKYGLDEVDFSLYDVFENEVGSVLGKCVQMVGKKGKSLLVKVENSIYHQEFIMRKKEIIRKINDYYGEKVIEDIKVI